MNQLSFVEPMKRPRFKRATRKQLVERFSVLADWYAVNKPEVKVLRISKDDARSVREGLLDNEIEFRQNGFHCVKRAPKEITSMSYRGFELVEVA